MPLTFRLAPIAVMAIVAGSCVPAPSLPPPSPASSAILMPGPQTPGPMAQVRLDGTPRQGAAVRGVAPAGTERLLLNDVPVPFAPDGMFIIAFDRDAGPSAELRAVRADGAESILPVVVAPAQWDIQHVNVSRTAGVPGAEYQRRRGPELARIAAARAAMTPESSAGWRQRFIWPVEARISGRFGSQRIYRGEPGSYHSGVDLAAPEGTTYVAPADGIVILVAERPYTLEGNLIIIDHGMGLNSAFLHSKAALVNEGDVVRQGQPVGTVGATGRATGPHLHWGMKWNDARIDPVVLAGR